MNIALTRNYIVEKHIKYALEKLKHKVAILNLTAVTPFKKFDVIFLDPYAPYYSEKIALQLKKQGKILVYWGRSEKRYDERPKNRSIIKIANHIFTCYKDENFNYLPLCTSSHPAYEMKHNYKWDVGSIIGNQKKHYVYGKGMNLLVNVHDNLKVSHIIIGEQWKNKKNTLYMKSYNQRFRNYWDMKTALNVPNCEEALPLRYFDAPRCNCFQLAYEIPQVWDIFKEDEIITFDKSDTMKTVTDTLKYWLSIRTNKEYRKIVQRAKKNIMKNHTYINRMKSILKVIK